MSVTPLLTPVGTPAHHIEVLMGTLDLSITAPCLAGRLVHYVRNSEVITQDRWVLQAISGYKLDLFRTPHQEKRSLVLHHSQTDHTLITQEVQELLAKQAIKVRSTNLPQQFHFSTLPGGKERGWAETSCQPEGSEQFRALRALQDGRPPYSPGFDSDWGLHDKTGSEGCIPADSNSPGSPTSPPVSVDGEDIPVYVPSLQTDISPKGIYQGAQATNWSTLTDGDSISGLPGRYPYPPSEQGGTGALNAADLHPVRSHGPGNQYQKILANTPNRPRSFWVCQYILLTQKVFCNHEQIPLNAPFPHGKC